MPSAKKKKKKSEVTNVKQSRACVNYLHVCACDLPSFDSSNANAISSRLGVLNDSDPYPHICMRKSVSFLDI